MRITALISFLLAAALLTNGQQKEIPKLEGPYLGQEPPGMTPEIFAPGIVSKNGVQSKLFFMPDGSEIIFKNMISAGGSPSDRKISFVSIKLENDCWESPVDIPFSLQFVNDEPALSPDGQKLFFVSNRPEEGNNQPQNAPDIWMSLRVNNCWEEPQSLGPPVNTDDVEVQPFYSTDDKLYFGRRDGIYCAQYTEGQFNPPVKLDQDIFNGRVRGVCISPDNKILIMHSDKSGGLGNWDLYVSFKNKEGKWGELINMGNNINTVQAEANATFSPDGSYLFFSRGDDIYWVSAKIFEELRPKI